MTPQSNKLIEILKGRLNEKLDADPVSFQHSRVPMLQFHRASDPVASRREFIKSKGLSLAIADAAEDLHNDKRAAYFAEEDSGVNLHPEDTCRPLDQLRRDKLAWKIKLFDLQQAGA